MNHGTRTKTWLSKKEQRLKILVLWIRSRHGLLVDVRTKKTYSNDI